MSTDGQASHQLFREIERDFEAIVRLIERTIEHLALNEAGAVDIERLARAKRAAEAGLNLLRMNSKSDPA